MRADRGFTLIEILITIVLLGTVVVTVLAAVQANLIASSRSRSAARVESAIVNVADRINRAPKECDYTIYANAAVQTEGWSTDTVTLQQWHYGYDGYDTAPIGTADWLPGACEGQLTEPPDLIVQRLLITVTSPDGTVTRSIELVKSDV
ncbi:MAG: prepilin-type N-terminal cleavage/methylation domain-containing protein [Ilumatobacter sp.]|nr:prepilin-type N-terminal cleavage/methylation domain-containing protein [Ilumatobacter sp.]